MAKSAVPLPIADQAPPHWRMDGDGRIVAVREAEHWERMSRRRVSCTLCYRRCELQPGEAGWCKIRANEDGALVLREHGVLAGFHPITSRLHYWRTLARVLWVVGVGCTSACSFCASTAIAWAPERMAWCASGERGLGAAGGWAYHRGMVHPEGVIAKAREWGCSGVYFGANEPTLTYEYTLDAARLAKRAGLVTRLDTNGFTDPRAIGRLAPSIDCVFLGIKGHADPEFYARHMRSEGAVPHVLQAARAWAETPTTLLGICDMLAPPHWMTAKAALEQQRRLYAWIAEELGPLTPVEIRAAVRPEVGGYQDFRPMLPRGSGDDDLVELGFRVEAALAEARAAGLMYAYVHNPAAVRCHHCGGVLVGPIGPVDDPPFERHVADGRCEHCGTSVPIVVISDHEAARGATGGSNDETDDPR